ncbi:MAG: hypothetical protein AAF805_00585 [Planctomycetota bacterium]
MTVIGTTTRKQSRAARRGATLLEVMTAVTLAATLLASSFVVLRSSHAAWQAHRTDLERAGEAAAVLRHVVRHARQSTGVAAITPPTDSTGSLSVVFEDGSTMAWSYSAGGVTLSSNGGAAQLLADGVNALTFEGFHADGSTPTNDAADVHAVRVAVSTTGPDGGSRTVSSYVWLRSW